MKGEQAEVVVDPVLLAGRAVFEAIASKEKAGKGYLLVFQLSYDVTFTTRRIAESIAKARGLEIIELVSSTESLRNRQLVETASPERFVSLFRDASYVVTTSYHGTVFSILFGKDFTVVDSFASERMANLLSALDLNERLVKNEKDVIFDKIDYRTVNKCLEEMRSVSETFLDRQLS